MGLTHVNRQTSKQGVEGWWMVRDGIRRVQVKSQVTNKRWNQASSLELRVLLDSPGNSPGPHSAPSHGQERPLSGQCLQEAWAGLQGGEMVGAGTVEKADFLPLRPLRSSPSACNHSHLPNPHPTQPHPHCPGMVWQENCAELC